MVNREQSLLDIVDENDIVIGTLPRQEYQKLVDDKLGLLRSAEVLIINDRGELWIPIRAKSARIAPGGLDYSIGCHVLSGETYEEAIVREAAKDHKIKIAKSHLKLQRKFRFTDIPYIGCVYTYRTNETPEFSNDDYSDAQWLKPADVLKLIEGGVESKSSLKDSVLLLMA